MEFKYAGDSECESCGSVAPLAQFPLLVARRYPAPAAMKLICEVCASTDVGRITDDANPSSDLLQLARIIAQSTNLILDEITSRAKFREKS